MNEREQKALYLLQELTFVDDALFNEALFSPLPAQRRRKGLKIALLCALLSLMSILCLFGMAALGSKLFHKDAASSADPPEKGPESLFQESFTYSSIDKELLLGKGPLLIWQEQEEESYHCVALSDEAFLQIASELQSPEELSGEQEAPTKKIWICDENGLVRSPYLEHTPGNLYYGTIFDYEPECLPNQRLLTHLEKLTS